MEKFIEFFNRKEKRKPIVFERAKTIKFELIPSVIRDIEIGIKQNDEGGVLSQNYPGWTMEDFTYFISLLNNRMQGNVDSNKTVI